ncbi:unnamed protein product [Paramecium pentaurelia]|uniref:Uncharacterized protein n=1 Tax=Paramecium pentaurelia TaxID=43138 RepID=A0A8S1RY14_9CILI|nr:unnamed protein product [Paramecium pentaurelia]
MHSNLCMNNEVKFEGQIIIADDVTQIGTENPQQKQYTLVHLSPKRLSKEGNAYSSPTRNSEGYMDAEEYQKEQEQQYLLNCKYNKKTRSQLVVKNQGQEESQTLRKTLTP